MWQQCRTEVFLRPSTASDPICPILQRARNDALPSSMGANLPPEFNVTMK